MGSEALRRGGWFGGGTDGGAARYHGGCFARLGGGVDAKPSINREVTMHPLENAIRMTGTIGGGVIGLAGLVVVGCTESTTTPANPQASPMALLPIEFTMRQRSTTPVPGSDDRLLITIGDITGGQVTVSAATAGGDTLLPERSMLPHTTARLDFAGEPLRLRLQRLDNALVGDDFATFEIFANDASLTEGRQIERLIQMVAELTDATFIRNGVEHSATEAADHLRMKWEAAGARITTAEQFIDDIASRSSITGKPYEIRHADGRIVQSGAYLRERLRQIEDDQ